MSRRDSPFGVFDASTQQSSSSSSSSCNALLASTTFEDFFNENNTRKHESSPVALFFNQQKNNSLGPGGAAAAAAADLMMESYRNYQPQPQQQQPQSSRISSRISSSISSSISRFLVEPCSSSSNARWCHTDWLFAARIHSLSAKLGKLETRQKQQQQQQQWGGCNGLFLSSSAPTEDALQPVIDALAQKCLEVCASRIHESLASSDSHHQTLITRLFSDLATELSSSSAAAHARQDLLLQSQTDDCVKASCIH